ncbi:MAG: TonB-dependent receptor [Bacteroidetes bacterium]|nr:TonB-dependent receptor [Bacteroidota bacterium]
MSKIYKLALVMLIAATSLFAQKYTVSGVVTSAETGEKLVGANVFLKGTTTGAATDVDGSFSIPINAGAYTVVCSYIGFETQEVAVDVTNNMKLDFNLKDYLFSLSVTVLADRAKERETPVAFTNIDKKDMELRLGSRDIPLLLNTTPSVYSTEQGGGAGDARINVRGFDQRNITIMINGVPVNDMENGWVYWSNWDGLGDATSSIQMQRGLSAVNLATPSIGGTMNIITEPTALKFGMKFKQEFGEGSFVKSTLFANTGLMDGKWAASASIVKKTGDGVINGTWTDAWAYYFGAAYNLNDKNRLEVYLIGAPQLHGQNRYKQNIATYNQELARELGYSQDAIDQFPEAGRRYSQNIFRVSPSYKGKQSYTSLFTSGVSEVERQESDRMNELVNFFHKPIANLNWYSALSKDLSLYTTAYWSGGHGGGTGTFGSMKYNYDYPSSRRVDWDATIANNVANVDTDGKIAAKGILRASRNNQWTVGVISKVFYKVNENLKTSLGIDWRTASIDHFRDIVDLLGADYWLSKDNKFADASGEKLGLGGKFNYNNTNDVNWLGGYGQAEYTKGMLTAYGTAGYSVINYDYTDHFKKDAIGNKINLTSDYIGGYQVKGGASVRLTSDLDVFGNAGYVSKVPTFDQVINDARGIFVEDQKNEKFLHLEAGANWKGLNGKLNIKSNVYMTQWSDRASTIPYRVADGSEALLTLNGISSNHVGFELEAAYQPIQLVRVDLSASFGNWKYTENVSGEYENYKTDGTIEIINYNYYIKDLKVGDQPQTQMAFSATFFPISGLVASAVYKYFDNNYANFTPFGRTNPADTDESWKIPSYGLLDLHLAYDIPFQFSGVNLQLFANVFNALDELYVMDAADNSSYVSYKIDKDGDGKRETIADPHGASAAEVFAGLPRTFNVGISIGL